MSEWDPRTAEFLLLGKKFAPRKHLHATVNYDGEYEVRSAKCGLVETYSGNEEIDSQTFAMFVIRKHTHQPKRDAGE
jgi:hypothetical protein